MDLERRKISSKVDTASTGQSLLDWISRRFTYHSAEKWREIIDDGQIRLNEQTCTSESILSAGDLVSYYPVNLKEPPVDLSYNIVHEDEYLMVVNKPGDLPCHPAGPFFKHTLWHALALHYGKIHIINRLDRETSGLLLIAKDSETAAKLGNGSSIISKEYRAMVFGVFNKQINADGYLIRDDKSIVRKKRKFVFQLPANSAEKGMKPAKVETILSPLTSGKKCSLVKARLKTGKLHQIRATLYSLGFPLLGDKLYGPDDSIYLKIRDNRITAADKEKLIMPRQALHSCKIVFRHPVSGQLMTFDSPVPDDFPLFLCR
ncbi:pseudouridine synthase [Lentisphaerota bacterium ZTH]|nr:hypothetical protein JYG24_06120 [Lentisphaerota bacterium]WET06919.1 pseudouridine synthase [Lentisphaerota bacterium ZTH]